MMAREKLIDALKKCGVWNASKTIDDIADYLISNGVTVQQWIPVAERLPEREKAVLVIDRVTGEVTAAYLNFCDSFCFEDGRGHGASHWMPLPQPPKEG